MSLMKTVKKVLSRKKRNGYYEASDILTPVEKQSLVIFISSLSIPILICLILISTY